MFIFNFFKQIFNFFRQNKEINIDTKQIIEIKKKIAYIEADMIILTEQYKKLIDRTRANEMTEGRANKKQTNKKFLLGQRATNNFRRVWK